MTLGARSYFSSKADLSEKQMNKTEWLLLAVILIALFLRFYGATNFPAFGGADEWWHYEIIQHNNDRQFSPELLNHYSEVSINEYYTRTPLYYELMEFIKDFYWIRLFNAFIGTISLIIAIKLMQLISDNKTTLYVTAFLSFLPSLIIINSTINPDTLCFFFAWLSIYFLFNQIKKHSWKNAGFAMLFFVLAISTKLVVLWFMPVLFFGLIYATWKHNKNSLNYLAIPLMGIIYFAVMNIGSIGYFGTNLDTIDWTMISIIHFSRFFAGFFLQEYGIALISNARFIFFGFFLLCTIVCLYYLVKKPINLNTRNLLIALAVIASITGMFYLSTQGVDAQPRYTFGILPLIPFAYYRITSNGFWRNALLGAIIILTINLFASISYGTPVCCPYPMPECLNP